MESDKLDYPLIWGAQDDFEIRDPSVQTTLQDKFPETWNQSIDEHTLSLLATRRNGAASNVGQPLLPSQVHSMRAV